MVTRKGFVSERQRRAFFATGNFQRAPRTPDNPPIVAFSYITPNKKLGKFKNLREVFKRFPSEKKAFIRVMKFRKKSGIRVNTIQEIKQQKRRMNINRRWDR